MNARPLKVGLDLDGVILYNPARIVRPLVSFVKKVILKRKGIQFFVPKTIWEQRLWFLFHKSSIFVAPGFKEIAEMARQGKIELYIVTARYNFLKDDFEHWLTKMGAKKYLKGWYHNKDNEQPFAFKEKMIKKLDLDIFVEDNWDIVKHLTTIGKPKKDLLVFWIYNLLDKKIAYKHKHPNLKGVARFLEPKRRTRLLVVSDYFYPHWTGISKAIYNMCRELRDNMDISVLTVRFSNTLPSNELLDGIHIYRYAYQFPLSRAKYSLSLLWSLITRIPQHDTILVNSPCSNILFASLLTKIFRKRLVIFHQGDLILPKGLFNRFIEGCFNVLTYFSCMLADTISTYTTDYAEHSRIYPWFLDKFQPMLMPVQVTEQKKKNHRTLEDLKKLKIKGVSICGFAGRFVEEKGFDILLQAIPEVIHECPQTRFIFAGETDIPYERFFERHKDTIKEMSTHVVTLGLLDDSELASFYELIDVIIIPSRSDCFNLVQAEAMLSKVPSVVSDIPGARYIVKQTGFGTIFPPGDTKALAAAIIRTLKTREQLMKKYPNVLQILNNNRNVETIRRCLEKRD